MYFDLQNPNPINLQALQLDIGKTLCSLNGPFQDCFPGYHSFANANSSI